MASTRRDFLKIGGMGVSISFLAPQVLTRGVFADSTGSGKILVVLQLAGGNDAVNTFIPYTDSRYRSMRPTLNIPDDKILKSDSRIGFHPSMAKLQALYDQRKFTFINNVGFSTLDRSHFRCQDVWASGDDSYGQAQRGVLGWLGRYADLYLDQGSSPVTTVSIGSKIAYGLNADEVIAAAISNAASFDVMTDTRYPGDREPFLAALRSSYSATRPSQAVESIRGQGQETFGAVDLLKTIPPPSATVTYPNSPLGQGLSLIAQMIAGNLGAEAFWISKGGFDTHAGQVNAAAQGGSTTGTHATLWADISDSLAAFYDDLAARGLSSKVLVLAWSEFGRRIQENASLGTDHGKAGTVFLMGDSVKGGTFYGDVPDLSNLDSGDLRTEIDFRSIYWTIIRDWFGKDPYPVLNGTYANLGFIQKPSPRFRAVRRG